MNQENIERKIICPMCGTASAGLSCPKCGEDVTAFHLLRQQALKCYNLGLSLAKNRKREAEECFNIALSLDPSFVEPCIVLGKLCAQQRRYPEAIRHWAKALTLDKTNTVVLTGLDHVRRAFGSKDKIRLEASWKGKSVTLGDWIQDISGQQGRIWRLLPDAEKAPLTHIVIWGSNILPQDIIIPVEYIIGIKDSTIFLNVDLCAQAAGSDKNKKE
jgi:tetratricopeptide (TPR) repeat protein